jgi:hypothetical protein
MGTTFRGDGLEGVCERGCPSLERRIWPRMAFIEMCKGHICGIQQLAFVKIRKAPPRLRGSQPCYSINMPAFYASFELAQSASCRHNGGLSQGDGAIAPAQPPRFSSRTTCYRQAGYDTQPEFRNRGSISTEAWLMDRSKSEKRSIFCHHLGQF